MHYIVTGCDGKLGGRTAKLMLQQVAPADLTFTCSFLDRLDPDEMVKAFAGGDRIFIVSAVTIGEIRVRQHKNVVDAAIAAGVKHITYTSFLGASDPAYAHVYVTPDHTATLLLGRGEDNRTYKICGSESIAQRDIVALISELSGREIEYCPVSHEEFFAYLDSMHIPRTDTGD